MFHWAGHEGENRNNTYRSGSLAKYRADRAIPADFRCKLWNRDFSALAGAGRGLHVARDAGFPITGRLCGHLPMLCCQNRGCSVVPDRLRHSFAMSARYRHGNEWVGDQTGTAMRPALHQPQLFQRRERLRQRLSPPSRSPEPETGDHLALMDTVLVRAYRASPINGDRGRNGVNAGAAPGGFRASGTSLRTGAWPYD